MPARKWRISQGAPGMESVSDHAMAPKRELNSKNVSNFNKKRTVSRKIT